MTAACLAEHYDVVGYDPDDALISALQHGEPPLFEPGLAELLRAGVSAGRLRYTRTFDDVPHADVLWITYDTPVDERDVPDIDYVARQVEMVLPLAAPGSLVVISSQAPVGFLARMEAAARNAGADVAFAYVPENLRLGQALGIFQHPDRIIAGVRTPETRERLKAILAPFSDNVVWMSPESAEMTKHALNSFLATSVTFINEIAGICEEVGADVKDVERGLKSESRIGPKAYLSAGGGFAGGTLARDVRAVTAIGSRTGRPTSVLEGVLKTNELQQLWVDRMIDRELPAVNGARIAVFGLTYKAGTDTLRRSTSIELCRRMHDLGATLVAYDPVVRQLPPDLASIIELVPDPHAALNGADVLVIGTDWPEFQAIEAAWIEPMRRRLVIDPRRFLEATLGSGEHIRYLAVGLPMGRRGAHVAER